MEPGTEFKMPYPFVMASGYTIGEEGPVNFPSWKPGIIEEETREGGSEILYHGVGAVVLTVVDTFKPKGWPTRVFYTRKWIDPQGRAFGKDKLRVTTLGYFNQLCQGYRYRQTAKSGGIQEAAESLAKSLNMPVTDLLTRLGLAG